METKTTVKIASVLLTVLLAISVGATFVHHVEGWSWLDSIYFSTATLTTVGYGDLVPHHDATKIFLIPYMLFGIATVLYSLGVISEHYVESRIRQFENRYEERKKLRVINEKKIAKGCNIDVDGKRNRMLLGMAILVATFGLWLFLPFGPLVLAPLFIGFLSIFEATLSYCVLVAAKHNEALSPKSIRIYAVSMAFAVLTSILLNALLPR